MGSDFCRQTLSERRAKLKALVGTDDKSRIQFSDEIIGDGAAFFKHVQKGPRRHCVQASLRTLPEWPTQAWLKTKCFAETELVIIGTDRDRKTGAMRALLKKPMGTVTSRRGIYRSDRRWLAGTAERLQQLAISRTPLAGLRIKARWVEPKLTAKVRHLAGAKFLRHAVVKTLI